MKPQNKIIVLLSLTIFLGLGSAKAQLNPLGGAYFQDQYLANPAFAGKTANFRLGLHYRNQWSSIPGAPVNYAISGEYGMSDERSGIGFNAYVDKAGLLTRTRAVGSYAYHLPLNGEDSYLHFGVSLGFMNEHVERGAINGNDGDIVLTTFNNQPTYIDGDFGVAYTGPQLTIQAAIPNLNSFLSRAANTTVDLGTYYGAVAYKILKDDEQGYNIEPKVAYRGIRGYKSIVDAGVELTVGLESSKINAMVVYHSSQSVTAGLGMRMRSKLEIQAIYNTQTAALGSYTNGTFELGLGVRF
jgi:type IX secretion system PorP/SprF family membrane protein